jgi:DNA-binding GntR family transcriptional regulator
MTIAEATGIPRETVRRKLKLLVERGVIVERTRGAYVFKPGYIQQPEMLDIIESGMRDALHFMNDCVKLGLVRWVDDAE